MSASLVLKFDMLIFKIDEDDGNDYDLTYFKERRGGGYVLNTNDMSSEPKNNVYLILPLSISRRGVYTFSAESIQRAKCQLLLL